MNSERLAELEILLERQAIQDCLVRFCRGMDRFDRELFLSAFHPDAEISAGIFVGGPLPLYDWAAELHRQGQSGTQHNLLNHSCEIDADTAHCETYYLFLGRNRDESNWAAGGRYLDRMEKRDGEWKIAFRHNVIEWSGSVPTMAIPFADVEDLALNGVAARDRSDPSYKRPLVNRRNHRLPEGFGG